MKNLKLLTLAICIGTNLLTDNVIGANKKSLYDIPSRYDIFDNYNNEDKVENRVSLKALQCTTNDIPEIALERYPILAKFLNEEKSPFKHPIKSLTYINEFIDMKNELLSSVEIFHKDVNNRKYTKNDRMNIKIAFQHILSDLKRQVEYCINLRVNRNDIQKLNNFYRKLNSERLNSISSYISSSNTPDYLVHIQYGKKYSLQWNSDHTNCRVKFE